MKIQFKVEEYYLNQNTNQQSQWVSVFVFDKTDNQPIHLSRNEGKLNRHDSKSV